MSRQTHNGLKRIFLAVGLGTMLLWSLSGCEKHPEEDTPRPAGKMIEFFARSNNASTRAADGHPIDGTAFPNNQSFGVYAYQTGFSETNPVEFFKNPETSAVAFNNTRITKDGSGNVDYTPKVRWPDFGTGKHLRFFAYYPYNHANVSIAQAPAAEQVDMTYTLPGDPSQHIDLMYWMSPQIEASVNQVEVDFNHALTRLRFEARLVPPPTGFPAGTSVKITRIEIKNASTRGTLRTTSGGNTIHAAWTPDNGTNTPLVLSAAQQNGLRYDNYQLPSSATDHMDLLETGGEMLVIPQNLTGVSMAVTANINGIDRIYTYDLGQTASSAPWEMNKTVTYRFAIGWNGISLSASVANWNDVGYYVVLDGPYYLRTSQKTLDMGANGATVQINIETNYDGLTGYPSGLRLDDSQAVADGNWCRIDMGSDMGAPGIDQRQVSVTVDPTGTARNTSFKVAAGNLVYEIKVRQVATEWVVFDPSSAPGFPLNGQQHSIRITSTSGSAWTIKSVDDPDGILLPTTQWTGKTGTDGTIYFYFKGTAFAGQSATLTVSGGTDKVFTITAVEAP